LFHTDGRNEANRLFFRNFAKSLSRHSVLEADSVYGVVSRSENSPAEFILVCAIEVLFVLVKDVIQP
jgi:hypothetical protein